MTEILLAAVLTRLLRDGNFQIKNSRLQIEGATRLSESELDVIARLIDPEAQ